MKKLITKAAERVAPRTLRNLKTLAALDEQYSHGPERFLNYERELATLRREIDELRRDNRRVAELYDVVFEWAKTNAVADGVAPAVDRPATVERMAAVIVDEKAESATPSRPAP